MLIHTQPFFSSMHLCCFFSVFSFFLQESESQQHNLIYRKNEEIMNRFLPSTFRNANQDVPSRRSLQKLQAAVLAKWNSTEASVQKNVSATDIEGFKGHGLLAPFTAGWQTMNLNPLVIDKSEGSYVYDRNGNKYLDSLAGLWCTSLGGNEPRLVAAATKQLNTLPFYHSFWNRTTKPSLDLAKEVLEVFTANKMGKVFFTNSGSEANDTQDYVDGNNESE